MRLLYSSITTRIFHFFVMFEFAINFLMITNDMQNKANHSFGDLRVFLPAHNFHKISDKNEATRERDRGRDTGIGCRFMFHLFYNCFFDLSKMNGNMIFE